MEPAAPFRGQIAALRLSGNAPHAEVAAHAILHPTGQFFGLLAPLFPVAPPPLAALLSAARVPLDGAFAQNTTYYSAAVDVLVAAQAADAFLDPSVPFTPEPAIMTTATALAETTIAELLVGDSWAARHAPLRVCPPWPL
jgi:hypothetical protein